MKNAVVYDSDNKIIQAKIVGLFNTHVAVEIFTEIDKLIKECF
jgi:hypothetical protein